MSASGRRYPSDDDRQAKMLTMSEESDVSTPELARRLGVGFRTVQRWIAAGKITPTWTTPGGRYRWDLDDVRRQLRMPPREED